VVIRNAEVVVNGICDNTAVQVVPELVNIAGYSTELVCAGVILIRKIILHIAVINISFQCKYVPVFVISVLNLILIRTSRSVRCAKQAVAFVISELLNKIFHVGKVITV
jgi:hypothetical protein